jgi:hypothetical protein
MNESSIVVFATALALLCWSGDASAIIGGSPDPAPSPVVALSGETSSGATGFVCTGTLVAPNVVLTARHCIEEGDPGCTSTFTGVAKYVRIGVTTENGSYEVASTKVPETNSPCGDDIALLVLTSAVPAADSPAADVRLSKAVKDEGYSAVGYGRTCHDQSCAGGGQRLRKDVLSVDCLDCRPRTWRGTSDSVCIGDSGGPAFDAQKRVLGVATVGGLGCTTSYYTRLDTHADFLRDTVQAEATKAGFGAPGWTTAAVTEGDAGTGPDQDGGPTTGDGGTPDGAPATAEEGCVVAPRSRSSSAINALFAVILVLLTRACRRSTRRARTMTSSARATRSIVVRTIPADTTRSSTISRSSSSLATEPARMSSSADVGRASSSSA